MLVMLLCRVGNIRSAYVAPKPAEQTNKVLLRPLMPRQFPKTAHEKHISHSSVYEKMEDIEQAVDTMRMYYATWTGRLQHSRDSTHLALLLLLLPPPPPPLLSATRYIVVHIRIRFSSLSYCHRQVAF